MSFGQDIEYNHLEDFGNHMINLLLPSTILRDDLLESDDEDTERNNEDITEVEIPADSSEFDVTVFPENEMSGDENDWIEFRELEERCGFCEDCTSEEIFTYFEGNEELVSLEEIDEYLVALENELQFTRSIEKLIIELYGEARRYNRSWLVMVLTYLVQGAPTEFLLNLEKKFLVDVLLQALKAPNDITMITNSFILLEHLKQTYNVYVNGIDCMEILYRNCKRHGPPKFIEVSLDLLMLGASDYGLSHTKAHKALEFCIRVQILLSFGTRKKLLCIIANSRRIIDVSRCNLVQRFLAKFWKDMPRSNRQQDIELRDGIISYLRKLYCQVMNEPELVCGITSSYLVKELHDMLKNAVFGRTDKHQIIEILSIIAVHSDSASLQMINNGIAGTLVAFFGEFPTGCETHKMDLVTFVWALMPNLPEEYSCNNFIRNGIIHSLKTVFWEKQVEEELWVPFTPKVNHEIERCHRRNKSKEVYIIENESICEVFLDKKVHVDHSTDKETAIKFVTKKVYDVLKLVKTKKSAGYRMKTNFVHFAFTLLSKRYYTCYFEQERYQSLEALVSLVLNMSREQHDRIVPITKNYTAGETVQHLQELIFNWKDHEIGIVAMQVVSALVRKFPDIYEEHCRKHGVKPTVEMVFKPGVEEKPEVQQGSTAQITSPQVVYPQPITGIEVVQEAQLPIVHVVHGQSTSPVYGQITSPRQVSTTPDVISPRMTTAPVSPSPVISPQVAATQSTTPQQLPTTSEGTRPPQLTAPQEATPLENSPRESSQQLNPPQFSAPLVIPRKQKQRSKNTNEETKRIFIRKQAKDLLRYIKPSEVSATSVLSKSENSSKSPNYNIVFEDIKKTLMENNPSLYELRASLAIPKLLKVFTDVDDKEVLNNKCRTFLNVFADLPKEENAKNFKIVPAPFEKLVQILNEVLKYCYQFDSAWPYTYSVKNIYAVGIKTISRIRGKLLQITVQSSDYQSIIFSDEVYPFTLIQYLESYLFHVMMRTDAYKDWNHYPNNRIELYLNDCLLPSKITVLEAVRRFQNIPVSDIYEHEHVLIYKLKYVDVYCPDTSEHSKPKTDLLESYFRKKMSIDDDVYYDQTLHLLQILYGLNRHWCSLYSSLNHEFIIHTKEFVNSTIDNLVFTTLIDPFNAIMQKYPSWMNIITLCPFLFSLNTRKYAFRVLSLDRRRALRTVLEYYNMFSDSLVLDNRYPFVKLKRSDALPTFIKTLLHTNTFSIWNVFFLGENGSGIGVKREFYSEVGKELQKEKYKIWMNSSVTNTGYIHCTELYPDFCMGFDEEKVDDFENASVKEKFYVIGQIMGKALMEGRLLDLPISLPVFKWLLKEETQLNLYDLKHGSEEIFKTLKIIRDLLDEQKRISEDISLVPETKEKLLKNLDEEWETVESFYLSFVVPKHEVELIPGGSDVEVTRHNAAEYVERMETFLLQLGMRTGMLALRTGFHKMVNLDAIQIFDPFELQSLICGEDDDEYWTIPHLQRFVIFSGYTNDSPEIKGLFEIMSTLSREKRQKFLEFVTACRRLPADGFAGLTPPMIVKRTLNNYPSVQTCFHSLSLCAGITKAKLEEFINVAIEHGIGYFGIV